MKKKRILKFLIPPPSWRLPVVVLLGIFFGLTAYTFKVSNAVSYLSDKPETCINCHIMVPQYATWNHSSHRERATCNDCHVPHNNVANKYYFKAKDGARHATMFTLRKETQVIYIHEAGKSVVQENCKRCHEYMNKEVGTLDVSFEDSEHGKGKVCWDCHREVPHGRVNSLTSTPNARAPVPQIVVPEWIENLTKSVTN